MTPRQPTELTPGTAGGTHRLLTGADMDPLAIRRAYPEARFVARARLERSTSDTEVWGVLLRDAAPHTGVGADVASMLVVTDDGRAFDAMIAGDGTPVGDPAAILAAAKYWELPPDYVRSLPGGEVFPESEG